MLHWLVGREPMELSAPLQQWISEHPTHPLAQTFLAFELPVSQSTGPREKSHIGAPLASQGDSLQNLGVTCC
jgi:hypothetical protein